MRYHYNAHVDPRRHTDVGIRLPKWIAILVRQGMPTKVGELYDIQIKGVLEQMNPVTDPLFDSRFMAQDGGLPDGLFSIKAEMTMPSFTQT